MFSGHHSRVGFIRNVSIKILSLALLAILSFTRILPAQPAISVSPDNLNFGEASIDQSVRLTLSIGNQGDANLTVSSIFTSGEPFSLIVEPDSGGVDSVWVIRPRTRERLYVEVFFTPRHCGSFDGSLTIISDDPEQAEFIVPLQGAVYRVGVSPGSIDFGGVRPDHTVERMLTIYNNSGGDLTVDELFTSGSPFSVDSSGFVIQPSACHQTTLFFTPREVGGFDGTLTILTDDEERGEVTVPLHGVGLTAPVICVSPENIEFGEASLGQSVRQNLWIENRGGSDLIVESLSISGEPFSFFCEADSGGADSAWVIRPGQRERRCVEVFFTPRQLGSFDGALTIISDDPSQAELIVPLHGVTYRVGLSPSSIDFGGARLNHRVERTLTIYNNGGADLTILDLFTSSNLFLVDTSGFVLQPNSNHQTTLFFEPDDVGRFEETLTIRTDDEERGEALVPLYGTGLMAPVIVVSPENIDFGEVSIGQSVSQYLRIENRGESDLIISSIFTSGEPFNFFIESDSGGVDSVWVIRPRTRERLYVEVFFTPRQCGSFDGSLSIISDDPENDVLTVALTGVGIGEEPVFLPHFTFIDSTGDNHSFLIEEVLFGLDMEVGEADEIGAFRPQGICVGASSWTGEPTGLVAWADDEWTEEVLEGFIEREPFHFLYWDSEGERELFANFEAIEGDRVFRRRGITCVRLTVLNTLEIGLLPGWNMISSNIAPLDPDLRLLLAPILEPLLIIKDETGLFTAPAWDYWGLTEWVNSRGYQLKMETVSALSLGGTQIPADTPIDMPAGWSLIAYYPAVPLAERVAFSNVVEVLALAKDGEGHFYNPEHDFSNMDDLEPGQGYQVKLNEPVEFMWNVDSGQTADLSLSVQTAIQHFTPLPNSDANMSILVEAATIRGEKVEMAAFSETGLCVGAAPLTGQGPWGLAVWGDDASTEAVDGLLRGESLAFKVWDGQKEYYVQPVQINDLPLTYTPDALLILSLDADALAPSEFSLTAPHPNPFNNTVKLDFLLNRSSDIRLSIFDLNGREVETAASGRFKAGFHSVVWQTDNAASGVYFARLSSNGELRMVKLVLLR